MSTTSEEIAVADHLFAPGEPGTLTYLHASRCAACDRVEFPPRADCPACGGGAEPAELRGPALLRVSSAVLAQPPGSRVEAPYGVGVAEFAEGVCVLGLLVDLPPSGASVDVVVHEPYPGGRLFAFRGTTADQPAQTSKHDRPRNREAHHGVLQLPDR